MKKMFKSGLTLVLIVLAAASCSKKQESASAKEGKIPGSYQIAYGGSACSSPIAWASLKGYYAEEGVDVELVSGASFEVIRSSLAAGKMPISNGDFQYFPSIREGLDVKLIAGLHEGCIKILVPNDSPIKTAADFKGKRIGVDEIGGTPMAVSSVAAGSVGIDPKTEIVWLPFPADQEVQALDKGEVDAVAVWDPFATIAEQTGNYRVIVDIATDPLFAGRNCCFIFASGKLIKENPKAVAATLRAINRAVQYTGDHPEEVAKTLVESKKVSTEDSPLLTTLVKSFRYDQHHTHTQNVNAKDDAVYFAQKLTEIGYLPADLNAQKFVDDIWVDVEALVN